MRGAPQVGFSTTILKISSRISFESLFLPTECCAREMSLQYKRKPAWCQPTTVSGVTTISEVPPIAPDPPGGHPEHFVEDADPRSWMPTLEHHKLLSQGEILKHQRTAGTEQAENRRETEPNDGKHSLDIPELDAMRSLRKSLILKPSSIFARHRYSITVKLARSDKNGGTIKQLTGVEITEDMPRLSIETSIERPGDDVSVTWKHWEVGRLLAPSYCGTPIASISVTLTPFLALSRSRRRSENSKMLGGLLLFVSTICATLVRIVSPRPRRLHSRGHI